MRSPFAAGFRAFHADELAKALSVLAEPHRLMILFYLNLNGELTITDLTALLPLSQPSVSHHVRKLVEAGLVEKVKGGTFRYCSLNPKAVAEVASALSPWQSR